MVFAYHCFASQDVVVVLSEAVGFVTDVLKQLVDRGGLVRGGRFLVCGRF